MFVDIPKIGTTLWTRARITFSSNMAEFEQRAKTVLLGLKKKRKEKQNVKTKRERYTDQRETVFLEFKKSRKNYSTYTLRTRK